MESIRFINRETGQVEIEQVYGGAVLSFLYGNAFLSKFLGRPLRFLISQIPFFSYLYGWWQAQTWTKRKIVPFIQKYHVNSNEFELPVDQFTSFNDFFIRKLKPEARPVDQESHQAIIPADARYLCYQNIEGIDGFIVKGQKFSLNELLQNDDLAKKYCQGTMVIARLCPTDYHRYHFPCDCFPSKTHMIKGALYSVNPLALRKNVKIFTENKRTLTVLESDRFGKILFLEIGATFVGSIHQTYTPFLPCKKGEEKGYFAFGGSSLILLFEPGRLILEQDLIEAGKQHIETKCLMGQSLGSSY